MGLRKGGEGRRQEEGNASAVCVSHSVHDHIIDSSASAGRRQARLTSLIFVDNACLLRVIDGIFPFECRILVRPAVGRAICRNNIQQTASRTADTHPAAYLSRTPNSALAAKSAEYGFSPMVLAQSLHDGRPATAGGITLSVLPKPGRSKLITRPYSLRSPMTFGTGHFRRRVRHCREGCIACVWAGVGLTCF